MLIDDKVSTAKIPKHGNKNGYSIAALERENSSCIRNDGLLPEPLSF